MSVLIFIFFCDSFGRIFYITDVATCQSTSLLNEFWKFTEKELLLVLVVLHFILECLQLSTRLGFSLFCLYCFLLCCFGVFIVLIQTGGFEVFVIAEHDYFLLVEWVFFEPSCKVLDRSLWFVCVDVCETFGNDFSDGVLLQVLQSIAVHLWNLNIIIMVNRGRVSSKQALTSRK